MAALLSQAMPWSSKRSPWDNLTGGKQQALVVDLVGLPEIEAWGSARISAVRLRSSTPPLRRPGQRGDRQCKRGMADRMRSLRSFPTRCQRPTPLVRTALSAILLSDGGHQRDLSEPTRPGSDYGVLFHALLRLAFNSAARRDEWEQAPKAKRSILRWAHANAVLGVLQRQDAAPKETARIFDGVPKRRVDDRPRRSAFSERRFHATAAFCLIPM